jgi:small subunit ribosomal protein S6
MEKNMELNIGKYELLYIVHPDLEASIDKITDRVKGIVESRGGKITYEENWGKRKLAYVIGKTDVGIYVLWFFEAPKASLGKIERDLKLTEEIIRYILLATSDKLKTKKGKKKEEKEESEKAEVKEAEEVITAKTEKKVEAKVTKVAASKKKAEKVESEAERMKVLDEKLGALLGDEEDNKDTKVKEKK